MPSHAPPNPGVPRRHPSRRTTAFGVVGFLLVLVVSSTSQAERPRVYAFKGATVVPAPGRKVESATVVIRDGLVEAVGRDVKTPPDAVEVEAKDLWIYPGLINAAGWSGPRIESDSGTSAPGSGGPNRAPRREPAPGPVHPISRIRPERQARDLLLPFEGDRKRDAETYRKLGFTTTLVAPPLGIFSGQSSAILLADDAPVADLILRDAVAQHLAFEAGSFGEGYPTVIVHADEIRQIKSAVAWAEKEGVRMVLAGAGDAWRVAELLRDKGIPVIVAPVLALPDREDEPYDTAYTVAAKLQAAGVAFCISNAGGGFVSSNTRNLPYHAGMASAFGLPKDEALKAVTLYPARILGVERDLGSIEVGKSASLIVTTGDPLEIRTRVLAQWIDGRPMALEDNKHERLYRKYKARPKASSPTVR